MSRRNFIVRIILGDNLITMDDEGDRVKVIGCSSLRGGGGELDSLKNLTYGSN